jgi:hypothetical protein
MIAKTAAGNLSPPTTFLAIFNEKDRPDKINETSKLNYDKNVKNFKPCPPKKSLKTTKLFFF